MVNAVSVNAKTLKEEIMDDVERTCGPSGIDHDWALVIHNPAFEYNTQVLQYSDNWVGTVVALTWDYPDAFAECNWCCVRVHRDDLLTLDEIGFGEWGINSG